MEKKSMLTNELVTRSKQYSFYKHLGILPAPDKVLSRGGRSYETLRDLKNDPHVWSCIQSRKSGLLSMKWKIDGSQPQTEVIRNVFDGLDVYNFLSDTLEAPLFGFQPIEIIWEYSANTPLKYIPKALVPKPQEWFFFDGNGKLRIRDKSENNGKLAPEEKILTVLHDANYMNPYGTSLLSKCYWSCTFKNGALRFWVNFMERYGMPVLLGQYTRGATDEEITKLAEVLGDMTENSVIVAPADINIKMEEAARNGSVDLYYELIKLCNAEISKAILSQTLTTELDSGSYAASQTHLSIRKEVIKSDVNIAERAADRLIETICKVNGINCDARFRLEESK